VYNLILGLIVVAYFIAGLPESSENISVDGILGFLLLAIIANVLFCAAYIPDIFAQLSAFRGIWIRFRWILFTIGLIFSAIITRWISITSFGLLRN